MLTVNQASVLKKLRDAVESSSKDADGVEWGTVYLSNAGSGRSFAATLGALKRAGYYKDYENVGAQHRGMFGKVKVQS
jgi:hypothetical protein